MDDQDFNIKVVTTADTSGLKQTADEMAKIRQQGLLAPIPAGLTGAKAADELGKIYPLLPQSAAATKEIAQEAGHAAVNIGKARAEAIILVRELASGVPPMRTLSSLLGSLGIPIAIAATAALGIYKAFQSSAEAVKKTREEQEKLNDQLSDHLRSAEKINSVEDWDKANDAIEDQIKLLQRRLYLATDTKEQESIFRQLQYAEQEKRLLPEIVAKGLERAAVERAVAEEIKAQVDAINEVARAYDRTRALSEQNAKAALDLRKIQRETQSDALKEKVDTGKITDVDAIAEKEKARAKSAAEDHDAAIEQVNQRMKANADEFADFDAQSKAAHKALQEQRAEVEKLQYLKTLPTSALEPDEREAVVNIKAAEDALKEQEATTKAIDENRRKAASASDAELPKLLKEKEVLDQIYQAEEARNKAISERSTKAAIGEQIQNALPQTKAVLMNEQAAAKARAEGREKDADMFQKSAEQFEKSMSPQARAQLEKLRSETAKPVGRKAGEGESQSAVDQLERNRINFDRQLKGEKPLEDKGKDAGLIDAIKSAFDQSMAKYWGP